MMKTEAPRKTELMRVYADDHGALKAIRDRWRRTTSPNASLADVVRALLSENNGTKPKRPRRR